MSYLKIGLLYGYNTEILNESVNKKMNEVTGNTKNTIFLSFSHGDLKVALGLRNFLVKFGITLYIDILESGYKYADNKTALRIKSKINELNYFFVLLTSRALESRWVPWELGIADGIKDHKNILIIPVEEADNTLDGVEFLGIYQRLELAQNKIGVFEPNVNKGILFENYFR